MRIFRTALPKLMLMQMVGLAVVATPQTGFRLSLRRADKRQPCQIRSTPNSVSKRQTPEIAAQRVCQNRNAFTIANAAERGDD